MRTVKGLAWRDYCVLLLAILANFIHMLKCRPTTVLYSIECLLRNRNPIVEESRVARPFTNRYTGKASGKLTLIEEEE